MLHCTEAEYRVLHPEKLRVYDIAADSFRDATQTDLDNAALATQAYGRLRAAMTQTQAWVEENLIR